MLKNTSLTQWVSAEKEGGVLQVENEEEYARTLGGGGVGTSFFLFADPAENETARGSVAGTDRLRKCGTALAGVRCRVGKSLV